MKEVSSIFKYKCVNCGHLEYNELFPFEDPMCISCGSGGLVLIDELKVVSAGSEQIELK